MKSMMLFNMRDSKSPGVHHSCSHDQLGAFRGWVLVKGADVKCTGVEVVESIKHMGDMVSL